MESMVITIHRNGAFESWRCYNCQRQGLIATECLFKQMGTRYVRELGEQGTEGQKEIHQKEEEIIIVGNIQQISEGEEAARIPL